MTNPLAAAAYLRVSTTDQAERYGLASQEKAVRDYATRQELEIVKVYSDAETGQTEDRPGIQAALQAAIKKQFEHLILYDHSRLGRNRQVSNTIRRKFQKAQIQIHYAISGGAYDSNSQAGVVQDTIGDMFSEMHVRKIVEDTRRGKRGAAEKGYVPMPGRVPFGYKRLRINPGMKDAHTLLEIDSNTAPLVARVFEMWNKGNSSEEIQQATGIPKRTVLGMLRNPVYGGRWFYGRTKMIGPPGDTIRTYTPPEDWIEVQVPAIISEETFNEAQIRIRAYVIAHQGHTKHGWLLRKRVKCDKCRRNYQGVATAPKGKPRHGYYAHQTGQKIECPERHRFRKEDLEQSVKESLWALSRIPPEKLDDIIDKEVYSDTGAEQELERVNRQLAALDQQLANIRRQLAEGRYTDQDFDIERQHIETERGRLTEQQKRLSTQLEPDAYELNLQEISLYTYASMFEDPANVDFFDFDEWSAALERFGVQITVVEGSTVMECNLSVSGGQSSQSGPTYNRIKLAI